VLRLTPYLLPLLLLLACSGTRGPSGGPGPGPELWVSPEAAPGGRGTRERPLRSLQEALARGPGVRVRLLPGRHVGPVWLPSGAQLQGDGQGVVLVGGVEAPRGAQLRGLTLEGGIWGVLAAGPLVLEDLTLSGQREAGVRLAQGTLQARGLRLHTPGTRSAVGVSLGEGVRARVQELRVEDAWARGLELRGEGQLELEGLRSMGPAIGFLQRGGEVHLRRAAVGGGTGAGVFVSGGTLVLQDVVILGHEYGLQAGRGTVLRARGLASVGARLAGLALVASRAHLEDVHVLRAGAFGSLQLLNSQVQLRRFGIQDAQDQGLSATQGWLEATAGHIVRTRSGGPESGEALHLRDLEARLHTLRVRGAGGPGVLLAEDAQVWVRDLTLEGCTTGGVLVDTRAKLHARGLRARADCAPAVTVTSLSEATLEQVEAGEGEALLAADCAQGARVRAGFGVTDELSAPCLRRTGPRAP
jgi:hypothetical protein